MLNGVGVGKHEVEDLPSRPGANTYGHTKEGAYMCEADATAEGDHLRRTASAEAA